LALWQCLAMSRTGEPPASADGSRTPAPATSSAGAAGDGIRFGVLLAIAAGGALVLVRLLDEVRGPLTWVVIGLLIAVALNPIVERIAARLRVPRGVAVALVLLLTAAVLVLMVVGLAPRAVEKAGEFTDDLPKIVDGLRDLPLIGDRIAPDSADRLTRWLEGLPDRLGTDEDALARGFQTISDGLVVAGEIFLVMIVTLIDGRRLASWAREQLPEERREQATSFATIASDIVGRYFAGSLIIAVLNGTLIFIIGLALGVPLAPFIAVWAMVTNLIPQIGGFLGGSVFVVLGVTQGVGVGLACLAWFLFYQQLENHVLQPAIVGEAVDISPAGTMVAALVGGAALGVPGAMVAIPFVGTIKAIYLARHPDRARPAAPPSRSSRLLARLRRRRGTAPGANTVAKPTTGVPR
jgi:predicted PurR-regulated permease PerM